MNIELNLDQAHTVALDLLKDYYKLVLDYELDATDPDIRAAYKKVILDLMTPSQREEFLA
jgi:hypothetical protein